MLDGIKRIIDSAKVQLLATAAFGAVTTYLMTPGTATEKRGLMETMITALAALVGAVILGWAHEDAASKAGPQNQTNVNSDVRNQPVIASATAPAPASQPPPAPVTPPFTPEQLESMRQTFAAMLAPHLRRPAQPPAQQPPQ